MKKSISSGNLKKEISSDNLRRTSFDISNEQKQPNIFSRLASPLFATFRGNNAQHGTTKFEFKLSNGEDFDLDIAEFAHHPSERIIYKICTIKMLLHECYLNLQNHGRLGCNVGSTAFTDIYYTEIVKPIYDSIFNVYNPEFASKYEHKHFTEPPSDMNEFNIQMGELIRDVENFILNHEGILSNILDEIVKIEEKIISIYNSVLSTCGSDIKIMDTNHKSDDHKTIADILFSSKKLLYYFSQLFLTLKKNQNVMYLIHSRNTFYF